MFVEKSIENEEELDNLDCHVVKSEGLLTIVLEGRMRARRTRGRSRMGMI